jgi:acetyl-CoA carboxylase biotin carboxyl carrier protein
MELTNEDVADILALLDSLPYDELDLRTSRFRLTLRRTPDGGWTQSRQVTAEPEILAGQPAGASGVPGGISGAQDGGPGGARTSEQAGGAQSGGSQGAQGGGTGGTGTMRGAGRPGLADVIAPLPGTFYRAPRPGTAPFVEVGSEVREDTIVAIVETMKLMNSVPAGTRGRVAEICLDNAAPVAQGAPLMRIDPEHDAHAGHDS